MKYVILWIVVIAALAASSRAESLPRQFVLADPDDFGSDEGTCIIPVSDPEIIGRVQSAIAAYREGGMEAVIELEAGQDFFVWIALGGDNVNRNLAQPSGPA